MSCQRATKRKNTFSSDNQFNEDLDVKTWIFIGEKNGIEDRFNLLIFPKTTFGVRCIFSLSDLYKNLLVRRLTG